jgi:hypothetical protein
MLTRLWSNAAMEEAIRELFGDIDVLAVGPMKMIAEHDAKKHTGNACSCCYVFVDLASEQDAAEAIENLHGTKPSWGSQNLAIRFASPVKKTSLNDNLPSADG